MTQDTWMDAVLWLDSWGPDRAEAYSEDTGRSRGHAYRCLREARARGLVESDGRYWNVTEIGRTLARAR